MRKGLGNPIAIVAEAIEKCGCSPEKFFRCVGMRTNAIKFDAAAEAEHFGRIRSNLEMQSERRISPYAVAFANWVLIKDIDAVWRKPGCTGGPRRFAASEEHASV